MSSVPTTSQGSGAPSKLPSSQREEAMPVYEFLCPACGERLVVFQHQPRPPGSKRCTCGARAPRAISLFTPDVVHPRYMEHVDETFATRGDMRRYMREHGLETNALL